MLLLKAFTSLEYSSSVCKAKHCWVHKSNYTLISFHLKIPTLSLTDSQPTLRSVILSAGSANTDIVLDCVTGCDGAVFASCTQGRVYRI